jgi:hypothetical protein
VIHDKYGVDFENSGFNVTSDHISSVFVWFLSDLSRERLQEATSDEFCTDTEAVEADRSTPLISEPRHFSRSWGSYIHLLFHKIHLPRY